MEFNSGFKGLMDPRILTFRHDMG